MCSAIRLTIYLQVLVCALCMLSSCPLQARTCPTNFTPATIYLLWWMLKSIESVKPHGQMLSVEAHRTRAQRPPERQANWTAPYAPKTLGSFGKQHTLSFRPQLLQTRRAVAVATLRFLFAIVVQLYKRRFDPRRPPRKQHALANDAAPCPNVALQLELSKSCIV
jgi:hypothetical protein